MLTIGTSIDRFKIPTILGLSIIILGIIAGIYLNLREQIFFTQAAPDPAPQNITITNITEDSATISWQTDSKIQSLLNFGQDNPDQSSAIDDKDKNTPSAYFTHHVTIKNLTPKTNYQFKITSGKIISNVSKFQTAQPLAKKTDFTPVIGSVLNNDNPVNDGIAYLSIPGAITQSAQIKTGGNFLIPLSGLRKDDLSDSFPLIGDTTAKLTIVSNQGTANFLFKPKAHPEPLPPIKLGQSIDLTIPNLENYDFNEDGQINAADYAILSSCFGKKIDAISVLGKSCIKMDINKDNKIDQKDLDLIIQKLRDSNPQ